MSREAPAVVVGLGELGGVLARGLLRRGRPVYPVTRSMSLLEEAAYLPEPAVVVVTVAEPDLGPVLSRMPAPWRTRLALVQNELLPEQWERHGIASPTVAVVWFEKKPGQDVKVLLPTCIHGPRAPLLVDALGALHIPARELDTPDDLLFELVRKNLYILTVNIAGLRTGGTVKELFTHHGDLAEALAGEVLDLQQRLAARPLPRDRLLEGLRQAAEADPEHRCTGRAAPRRLERALAQAADLGLPVPVMRSIAAEQR